MIIKIFHCYQFLFFYDILRLGENMQYLDGKNLQKIFLNEIKEEVLLLGIKPLLVVISTGDNNVNEFFIRQVKKMCDFVHFEVQHYHYADVSEGTLYQLIDKFNHDSKVTSILVVNPLMKHLQTAKIRNAIRLKKDVDGMNDFSRINYFDGEVGFLPATVLGIKYLLEGYSINVKEKDVVIVNRGEMLGKTLANYFLKEDCTVTICHSKTNNLVDYLKKADIVITAMGNANVISSDIFKENSIVIDIGIDEINGTYYGDVSVIDEEINNISYLAKSIGGVGPMTIAALAQNILKSYYLSMEDKENSEF